MNNVQTARHSRLDHGERMGDGASAQHISHAGPAARCAVAPALGASGAGLRQKRMLTKLNMGLAVVMSGALLVAGPALGPLAAYIAMIASLLVLLNPASWASFRHVLRHPTIKLFLLAYALIALSLVYRSLKGDSLAFVIDFLPLALSMPAAAAFLTLRNGRWLEMLFAFALLGSFVALAVTTYGAFGQSDRPAGYDLSPIHFSSLALILGFIAAGGFLSKPGWLRAIYLLGVPAAVVAALMTGTRATLFTIGLIVLADLVLVIFLFNIRRRYVIFGFAGTMAALAVLIAMLLTMNSGADRAIYGIWNAALAVFSDPAADPSMAYRIEMYRAFWPAFLEAPIFGHGWHNQLSAAYPYLSELGRQGFEAEHWSYIHNEAMSLTLSMGICGLAAFVLLYAAPVAGLLKAPSRSAIQMRIYGVTIVLIGLFASGLTDVLLMVELPKTMLIFISTAFLFVGGGVPESQKDA